MRTSWHRKALAIGLVGAGLALLLLGTAASLGLQRDGVPASQATTETTERARSEGLAAVVSLDVDAPLVPVDPVTYHAQPELTQALPLPGAGLDRDATLREAGLGVAASVDLLTGSSVAREHASGAPVGIASQRATLTPAIGASVAAAAAFTIAGAVVYFWGAIKTWSTRLALAPALALYAKITRAEVFDNSVRERIFDAIRANPGLSASDLARLADVSWGTTIYHLDVLEQTRMVTSLRKGRYRRYFENGASLGASKDVVALLRNPVTAGVVTTLQSVPGATQKELAAATNMSPQALHWHLARLVANGIVRKEREGRVVRHFTQVPLRG